MDFEKKESMLKDNGTRADYGGTGALKEASKDWMPELISPIFTKRLAAHLAKGAKKYGERNWEKGIPIEKIIGSLLRHITQYQLGYKDEDHLAAIACNAMFLLHTDTMISNHMLPQSLDSRDARYITTEEVKNDGSIGNYC